MRKTRRCLKRFLGWASVTIVAVLVLQSVYFYFLSRPGGAAAPSDIIVIFRGEPCRLRAGFELAAKGIAPAVFVPGVDEKELTRFEAAGAKFRPEIIPGRCLFDRTTFEDALCTRSLLAGTGPRSILLVTSADHMPRAYALLRLVLLGRGVAVAPYGVIGGKNAAGALLPKVREMARFWGSLVEVGDFELTGRLSGNRSDLMRLRQWIKTRGG